MLDSFSLNYPYLSFWEVILYMPEQPEKRPLPLKKQEEIREKATSFVVHSLLPNKKISKIFLFGSLARREFGKYEKPFRGRSYSDIDIMVITNDGFKPNKKWKVWLNGKYYDIYNVTYLDFELEDKVLLQYAVVKDRTLGIEEARKEGEKWGVPLLLSESSHPTRLIYSSSSTLESFVGKPL
jgi:predicted nucleotidyltransferase